MHAPMTLPSPVCNSTCLSRPSFFDKTRTRKYSVLARYHTHPIAASACDAIPSKFHPPALFVRLTRAAQAGRTNQHQKTRKRGNAEMLRNTRTCARARASERAPACWSLRPTLWLRVYYYYLYVLVVKRGPWTRRSPGNWTERICSADPACNQEPRLFTTQTARTHTSVAHSEWDSQAKVTLQYKSTQYMWIRTYSALSTQQSKCDRPGSPTM